MTEAMSESEQPQPSNSSRSNITQAKFAKFKAAVKRQLDDIINEITARSRLPFEAAIEYPANLDHYNEVLEKASYVIASMHTRGECEEELQWQERTLQLREVMLGREHQDTLRNRVDIGITQYDLKWRDKAERTISLAVEDLTAMLGLTHSETLRAMVNHAVMLGEMGRHTEAQNLHIKTLELRKTSLPPDDPEILSSMNGLALVLMDQRQYNEAETIYRQTLPLRIARYGDDYPDTLNNMENLAIALGYQEQPKEACDLLSQVLGLKTAALGSDHNEVKTTRDNLKEMTYRAHLAEMKAAREEQQHRVIGSSVVRHLSPMDRIEELESDEEDAPAIYTTSHFNRRRGRARLRHSVCLPSGIMPAATNTNAPTKPALTPPIPPEPTLTEPPLSSTALRYTPPTPRPLSVASDTNLRRRNAAQSQVTRDRSPRSVENEENSGNSQPQSQSRLSNWISTVLNSRLRRDSSPGISLQPLSSQPAPQSQLSPPLQPAQPISIPASAAAHPQSSAYFISLSWICFVIFGSGGIGGLCIGVRDQRALELQPSFIKPTYDDPSFYLCVQTSCWLILGTYFTLISTVTHARKSGPYCRWTLVWLFIILCFITCVLSIYFYVASPALSTGLAGLGSAVQALVIFLSNWIFEKGEWSEREVKMRLRVGVENGRTA